MSRGNKKKKWIRPKLIVLVRGKPEERCLTVCKGVGIYGPSTGDCMGALGGESIWIDACVDSLVS